MRFASKVAIILAMCAAALGQQKINPNTGINWPVATGNGAPAASCTSLNYGQLYTDLSITPNMFYTCGNDGWQVRTGPAGPAGPPGSATILQTNGTNNGSQTTLNLKSGAGATVTNSGADVTISATGSASAGPVGTMQAAGSTAGTFAAATAANVMNTLGTPPGMFEFGDSICYGVGASNLSKGYCQLLKPQIGGQLYNYSVAGNLCVDNNNYIIANVANQAGSPNMMNECGTNDVTTYNSSAPLQLVFQRIVEGNLLFMAIPQANMVFAQNSNCVKTTGFATADNTFRQGLGQSTVLSGDVLTCHTTTTSNGEVAVGWRITSGGAGTFTIKINGTNQTDSLTSSTTFLAYGDSSSAFATGTASSAHVGQIFSGFTPNATVTVVFTSTAASSTAAPVEAEYIAAIPATLPQPQVLVISPNHQNNSNDTLSGTYAGYESAIVTALDTAGLNVTYVDTRSALGTNYGTYYADAIHPNDGGHALMDTTVEAAAPGLLTGAPTNLYFGSNFPYPVNAAIAPNPSQWWTPNLTQQVGDGVTTWPAGGILLGGKGSAIGFTGYDPQHGAFIAGPEVGSSAASSMCSYSALQYPSSPTSFGSFCPIWISSANFAEFGTRTTDGHGGLIGSNGSLFFNGAGTVSTNSVGTTSFNGVDNFFDALASATGGTNFNSVNTWWVMSGISGSADVGLFGAIGTGATPNMYLTLGTKNNPLSYPWGLDISNATAVNHLGSSDATTLNSSTYKVGGTTGFTGTCAPTTTITVVSGIITGCT